MAAALISVVLALAQTQSLTLATHELGDSPHDASVYVKLRGHCAENISHQQKPNESCRSCVKLWDGLYLQIIAGRHARLDPTDGPISYDFTLTRDESGAELIPLRNEPPHGKAPASFDAGDLAEVRSPADYGEFGPVRDLTFGQIDVSIRVLEFEVKNLRGLVTFESLSCLVRAKENGQRQ